MVLFLLIFCTQVFGDAFQISEIEGTYGSRRFNGAICTWEKCQRPEMYRAHYVKANLVNHNVHIQFVESDKVFRELIIPQARFIYYDQEFGGYSEGFETYFGEDPIFREKKEENGFTVIHEEVPVLEIRFVKFKNQPTDSAHLYGYEHIEGFISRVTVYSKSGDLVSRQEHPGQWEISNQYVLGRSAQPPNY